MAKPRDFTYIRKLNITNKNKFIISSKSIFLENYPESDGMERGDILRAGHVIERIDDNNTSIKTYSEVNTKNTLPFLLVKIPLINSIKKFVESALTSLNNNF